MSPQIFTHPTTHKLYFQLDLGRVRPQVGLCPIFLVFIYFLISHRISELPQPIATKLCLVIYIGVNFIMHVQKFGGLP